MNPSRLPARLISASPFYIVAFVGNQKAVKAISRQCDFDSTTSFSPSITKLTSFPNPTKHFLGCPNICVSGWSDSTKAILEV